MLSGLLWSWIDSLSEPVLTKNSLCYIVLKAEKPLDALIKLDQVCDHRLTPLNLTIVKLQRKPIRYTIEYLLRFIARLSPDPENRTLLVQHLFARLTRQRFKLSDGKLVPDGVGLRFNSTIDLNICFIIEGLARNEKRDRRKNMFVRRNYHSNPNRLRMSYRHNVQTIHILYLLQYYLYFYMKYVITY